MTHEWPIVWVYLPTYLCTNGEANYPFFSLFLPCCLHCSAVGTGDTGWRGQPPPLPLHILAGIEANTSPSKALDYYLPLYIFRPSYSPVFGLQMWDMRSVRVFARVQDSQSQIWCTVDQKSIYIPESRLYYIIIVLGQLSIFLLLYNRMTVRWNSKSLHIISVLQILGLYSTHLM